MELRSQLLPGDVVGTVAQATPEKRTGRKSMSRRSGQNGCIQEDGNWYIVRFWKDVAGQEKRQREREKICPIYGPSKLSASERKHKAKEIIAASGADTAEHFQSRLWKPRYYLSRTGPDLVGADEEPQAQAGSSVDSFCRELFGKLA